jgi:hypothetical protein
MAQSIFRRLYFMLWLLALAAGTNYADAPRSRDCTQALKSLLGDRAGQLSSREYLSLRLQANYAQSREEWYEQNLASHIKRALRERLDMYRFYDEGLKRGERVVWVQQGLLKELNEKLWDIGGTEYYLLRLDEALSEVLDQNPAYGRIVHRNYKDRVIVTSLSSEDFEKRVLSQVKHKLAQRIGEIRERPGQNNLWETYIAQSIKFSDGTSIENAYVNLTLKQFRMNYDEWQKTTVSLRNRLKFTLETQGIAWAKVLKAARRFKDSNEALVRYVAMHGVRLDRRQVQQIRYYMRLMRLADFLPMAKLPTEAERRFMQAALERAQIGGTQALNDIPRLKTLLADSWGYRRALFLGDVKNSHHMMATDISGLGERAMLAQDAWIEEGAHLSRLENIYEGTTRFLDDQYESIERELRRILGEQADIHVYSSGDDALWGLPQMTIEQMNDVRAFLKSRDNLYSQLSEIAKPGDPESIAFSVHHARDELFRLKPELKEAMNPLD